jgi:F1F0 ATPase subunit 2
MMSEGLRLLLALTAGGALGVIFFGGLWWTVRKGMMSRRPGLWFLGSTMVRTGVVLAGFYVFGGHDWKRLLLCLGGFALARIAVTWFTGRQVAGEPPCNLLPIR